MLGFDLSRGLDRVMLIAAVILVPAAGLTTVLDIHRAAITPRPAPTQLQDMEPEIAYSVVVSDFEKCTKKHNYAGSSNQYRDCLEKHGARIKFFEDRLVEHSLNNK